MFHRETNTEHESVDNNDTDVTELKASSADRVQQRHERRQAGKSCLQIAWSHTSHEWIAGVLGVPRLRVTKALNHSTPEEAPISWLLEVDDDLFERAVDQLRVNRAYARLMGGE